ncbi:hypothetical protein DJ564_10465 [Pseudomonas sp. 31-12]|nr:hypothetical protein DJ564_10465 [Pseudomonas sp. 31-12]
MAHRRCWIRYCSTCIASRKCRKRPRCSNPPLQTLKIIVGASLLAIAEYQSTLISTDTPSSRASPLPQGLQVALAGLRLDPIPSRLLRRVHS